MENEYNILKDFDETCFALNKAESELTKITIETFILNPEIKKLTSQIKELNNKKEMLKAKLKEDSNGKESVSE